MTDMAAIIQIRSIFQPFSRVHIERATIQQENYLQNVYEFFLIKNQPTYLLQEFNEFVLISNVIFKNMIHTDYLVISTLVEEISKVGARFYVVFKSFSYSLERSRETE